MALGSFKFTSLYLCVNSGVITACSSDGSGNATVIMAQPIELFAGETVFVAATGTDFDNVTPQVATLGPAGSQSTASGVPPPPNSPLNLP